MTQTLISYIIFFVKSKNEHGVHSPFVFNLITKCIYVKTDYQDLKKYRLIKRNLLNNDNFITVTDFGAGSKIFKSEKRKISRIAQIAGISDKKSKLLIRFVAYYKPKKILEIGTSLGLGTAAIKLGNQDAVITTLEGCENTAKVAIDNFNKFKFKNIEVITGNFNKTISKAISNKEFDLIYLDGNHTKKATLDYFEKCLPTIHNESIFIFDDIHWSSEMEEAWETIKKHPKVTVTIDVFYWGIIFFRVEQAKEHFTIRV